MANGFFPAWSNNLCRMGKKTCGQDLFADRSRCVLIAGTDGPDASEIERFAAKYNLVRVDLPVLGGCDSDGGSRCGSAVSEVRVRRMWFLI